MSDTDDANAAARAADLVGSIMVKLAPFRNRGLSNRVIEYLIEAGVDAPERLLFMAPAQLHDIPGIGKSALAEIMKYRSKFIPKNQFKT